MMRAPRVADTPGHDLTSRDHFVAAAVGGGGFAPLHQRLE